MTQSLFGVGFVCLFGYLIKLVGMILELKLDPKGSGIQEWVSN
ncbi:MAG: hypothetical protein R2799_13815 [Crocinitomicaceae bacterium]